MADVSPSLILLTYKGKALLMHKQKSVLDDEKHPWSFISGVLSNNEPFQATFTKRIHKEMGIKIANIEFLSDYCYHARLTDSNVNSIQRSEHQLLDFFDLKELKKLFLSEDTNKFVLKHWGLIQKEQQYRVETQS